VRVLVFIGHRPGWGGHGAQHCAHDFGRQPGCAGFEPRHRLLFIAFQRGAGLLDLFLSSGAGLLDGLGARLAGLLAPGFLALEDFLAGFAEALLVIGSAGFGRGDVGARFFHRSLGAAAAFGKNRDKRPMDEERIKDV